MTRRWAGHERRRAVILVMTLLVLALLTTLTVALAALVRLETRGVETATAAAQARAEALAALQIALGELQRHAGPDARVTAPAGPDRPNAAWTGVWRVDSASAGPETWLVSGNEQGRRTLDPAQPLIGSDAATPELVWLRRQGVPVGRENERVALPRRAVRRAAPGRTDPVVVGYYAYWVGDEGVKLALGTRPWHGDDAGISVAAPELDRVFTGWIPDEAQRGRIELLGQATQAGFDPSELRAWEPHLAAHVCGLRLSGGEPEWVAGIYNVNGYPPRPIAEAVLGPGEVAFPAEIRAAPAALATARAALHEAWIRAPRPIFDLAAFRAHLLSALPDGTMPEAYWAVLDPRLATRSDTFLVRAYGEAVNPARPADRAAGAVAWLEVLVERTPAPHPEPGFGRLFRIRWLRWLSPTDV